MSYEKTQGYVAQEVLTSDNANVPYTTQATSGVNATTVANQLVASVATDFIVSGVKAGDIVYNTTSGKAATVQTVVSATVATLNADIFTSTSQDFIIYVANAFDGNYQNAMNGCVLYVGSGGALKVTTITGDTVTFVGVVAGSFFPVQVRKVWENGTTAGSIIALW